MHAPGKHKSDKNGERAAYPEPMRDIPRRFKEMVCHERRGAVLAGTREQGKLLRVAEEPVEDETDEAMQ